jgi:hypothetical protein
LGLLSNPHLFRGAAVAGVALALGVSLAVILLPAKPSGRDGEEAAEGLLKLIADQTTYGYIDDDLSLPVAEERLDTGERLFVSCGKVSLLAQRMLADRGVESRLAATITRQPFNGIDDGHTMLEVRRAEKWELFDLGNNRVAVDENGEPLSFIEQIRAGKDRRWRVLSGDSGIDLRGLTAADRRYMQKTFIEGGLERWYDRVLGIPLVEAPASSGSFVFHQGRAQIRRYNRTHGSAYEWVDAASWRSQWRS